MKKILLWTATLFLSVTSVAQNLEWAKTISGQNNQKIYGSAIDDNGNIYSTGEFWGTTDFDPGTGTFELTTGGYSDIFVLKLTTNGDFIWAKNFQSFVDFSTGRDIKVDDAGNVYTTGKMKGNVDFDPGTGVLAINGPGSDIFIHKLDSNGDLDWVRTYGGSGQWVEEGQALAMDDQGNIYLSGIFMSTVDFDSGLGTTNLTSVGTYPNVFVLKLTPDANFVWVKGFGSTSNHFPSGQDLAVQNDDIYIVGEFTGTVDFNTGAGIEEITDQGSGDIYIEKLDTAGNFEWVKTIGDQSIDEGIGIATDYFGNAYITGTFSGTVDFDPAVATANVISSEGNLDAFVLKLDETGSFDWAFSLGENGADYGNDILVDEFGTTIWTTGSFAGTVDFDPTGVSYTIGSLGLSDGFIQKINQSVACIPTFVQITAEVCNNETYQSPSGNHVWNQSGNYTDTLLNINGCDSVLTIELTVLASISELLNMNICNGDSYTSPSGNYVWSQSGSYTDTILSTNGCDSVLTINLTVLAPITTQLNPTICDGDTYTSPSGNYTWNQAGNYIDTLSSANGCDSLLQIALTIESIDNSVTQQGHILSANQTGMAYQWIDCDNNNSPITGETSENFTASSNGTYAVEISSQNCTVSSSCYTVSTVSLHGFDMEKIDLYPNPTNININVELPTTLGVVQLSITNSLGQLIKTKAIDGSTIIYLPKQKGIYFIQLSTKDDYRTYKVVKN